MSIQEQEQSLNPFPVVYLYELDFSTMKGGTATKAHWTPYRNGKNPIVFGGVTYAYMGVGMSGIEMESGGKLPAPSFTIFQQITDPFFYKALTEDVRGIRITRIKTYSNFLDGGPNADASKFRQTMFYINGLERRAGNLMTFRLSTNYGLEGVNNKANRVLNTFSCINKYRIWNPDTQQFIYTASKDGGCPWGNPAEAGNWPASSGNWGASFDGNDEPVTDPAKDRCPLTAKACMKRFASSNPNNPIPYTADPKGIGKGGSTGCQS